MKKPKKKRVLQVEVIRKVQKIETNYKEEDIQEKEWWDDILDNLGPLLTQEEENETIYTSYKDSIYN